MSLSENPTTAMGLGAAAVSALLTGVVAAVLSFPASCDATFAPFMSDCHNVVGWSSFADYPTTAAVIAIVAAFVAGAMVYLLVRFSDS